MQMRLTHPPVRAQASSQGRRGMRARLPSHGAVFAEKIFYTWNQIIITTHYKVRLNTSIIYNRLYPYIATI